MNWSHTEFRWPHVRSRVAASLAVIWALAGCVSGPVAQSARSVVEAKFAAVNRHAIEQIEALYATDAVLTAPDFCSPRRGRGDVRRTYRALFDAYPDISADVEEYLEQGDRVAVRLTVRSRLPGRSFEVPILNFFTVKSGLIVSDEGMFDTRGRKCSP
jgi:ketosteroid isomerase-like protein